MEVRTVGDILLYLGAIAGAMLTVGGLLHYLLVKPLRRWIREQVAVPAERAARKADLLQNTLQQQVGPNGGSQETTRHLIEEVHRKVDNLSTEMVATRKYGQENRDLATAALSLAQQTSDRVDRLMEAQLGITGSEQGQDVPSSRRT